MDLRLLTLTTYEWCPLVWPVFWGGDKGLALTVIRCEIQKPGAGGLAAEKGFPSL